MSSCDLLSNSYLCSICDSSVCRMLLGNCVVICFQILTFAVSATAQQGYGCDPQTLWFAFKFLPLQYLRQRVQFYLRQVYRCDLLSNSYLCSICDSSCIPIYPCWSVVICFQILTFAVSATALLAFGFQGVQLWFAFKFLPLQYLRQPLPLRDFPRFRCDLLSNSYLCSICDSLKMGKGNQMPLWFAFKFLPLQYLRQHKLGFCFL